MRPADDLSLPDPRLLPFVEALAEALVADYLREEAAVQPPESTPK